MDTRRKNLRLLAAQWGGPTGLAKKLHLAGPSYISQLVNGNRPFTEKTARKFESELELPAGWMDQDHQAPVRVARVDESLVRQVVLTVGAVLEEMHVSLSPTAFADLVEVVYEDAARRGELDEAYVRRVARLTKR
jgi:plasmid maintenance system antidote protein VapI